MYPIERLALWLLIAIAVAGGIAGYVGYQWAAPKVKQFEKDIQPLLELKDKVERIEKQIDRLTHPFREGDSHEGT